MPETNENGFNSWETLTTEERIRCIKFLDCAGYTTNQIGEALQVKGWNIRYFCRKHNIETLYKRGAQPNNKNAFVNGMGINTIQRLTRKVLLQAGRDLLKCERCNAKSLDGVEFPRHHKDRDRSNNDPTNLEVLCQSCHATEHITDRQRNEIGQFA